MKLHDSTDAVTDAAEEREEAQQSQHALLARMEASCTNQAVVLQMHDGSLRAMQEQLEQRADAMEVVRLQDELASMKRRFEALEAVVARKVSMSVRYRVSSVRLRCTAMQKVANRTRGSRQNGP
jgi:CRP-like cAMP-binding protein